MVSVRTYTYVRTYKTKQTDQRVKPLFKLVLWLVLGRGSLYESSHVFLFYSWCLLLSSPLLAASPSSASTVASTPLPPTSTSPSRPSWCPRSTRLRLSPSSSSPSRPTARTASAPPFPAGSDSLDSIRFDTQIKISMIELVFIRYLDEKTGQIRYDSICQVTAICYSYMCGKIKHLIYNLKLI